MDKYGPDLDRLCSAVTAARLTMRWNREQMRIAARQTAGSQWSEEASRESIPFNFLSLYQKIALRTLSIQEPRVMLSTFSMPDKPAVHAMESWMNETMVDDHLLETFQTCAQAMLFNMAICKVGVADPAESAMSAWAKTAGDIFAEPIGFEDWIWDIHARHPSECSFMGHYFRVPLQAVKESKLYSKARKDLTASEDPRFNPEGDEKINVLGRGYYGADEEMEDMVDLVELYLPRHRCVITLPADSLTGVTAPAHGGKPVALREVDWIGPPEGPYIIGGFEKVLGNLGYKGPMMDLLELHLALNNIGRKLIRQSHDFKTILAFRKGSDGDLKRVQDSSDTELVPMDDPQGAQKIEMNGPNQLLFQFWIQLKEIFSWFAGNLDVAGGLSPQGRTATQEKILNSNSSGGMQDLQSKVTAFNGEVFRRMCWWHWHHPKAVMKSQYAIPGLESMGFQRHLHPHDYAGPPITVDPTNGEPISHHARTGNWEDMDLQIDEYSIGHRTPEQAANDLLEIVTKFYIPSAAIAKQQGVSLDYANFLEKLGRYKNMPDLPEILKFQDAVPPEQDQGAPPQPGAPPQATEHVRTNMPGRTQQGDSMNRMNALAGVDPGGNPSGNGQLLH